MPYIGIICISDFDIEGYSSVFNELPVATTSLQAVVGVLLATGLLFYISRFNERTKLTILATALVIVALIYVLFALVAQNPLYVAIEIIAEIQV